MNQPGVAPWMVLLVAAAATLAGCGVSTGDDAEPAMNAIAESYVRLVLAVGQHDPGYVDAYYGPEEWRAGNETEPMPLEEIGVNTASLLSDLDAIDVTSAAELLQLRHLFLTKQLVALAGYIRILGGEHMTFDEESEILYDAVAPTHPQSFFEDTLAELNGLVPGEGPLQARLEAFQNEFMIPADRLDAAYQAAIKECRSRTLQHMDLPEGESFELEYVTAVPWGAYNWYQGDSRSLIQINTDNPTRIDRPVGLAAHEGYPGHHVFNASLELLLVDQRGWIEFSIYPLYSPQSLIAEGTANYGIELAFPRDERIAFEKQVLFPLAGLDPDSADLYYQVQEALRGLEYAGNEAARMFVNGELDAAQTADWLVRYAMYTRPRAEQHVRFIDHYRSYVINYNLGEDLVREHVERKVGSDADPQARWQELVRLLTTPQVASGLE